MSDSSGGSLPPAGWYADPERAGQERYWDGQAWTDERRPTASVPPPPPASGPGNGGDTWGGGGFSAGGGSPAWGGGAAGGGGTGGWGTTPAGPKPDPWLWQSIVATVLCCLPLGIAGIVFATQSQSAWSAGNATLAREKAQKAKTWTLAAVGVGFVVTVLWAAAMFAGGMSNMGRF